MTFQAGADFIGMVFAESKRRISAELGERVITAVKRLRCAGLDEAQVHNSTVPLHSWCRAVDEACEERSSMSAASWFWHFREAINAEVIGCKPLMVGVFADQTEDEVRIGIQCALVLSPLMRPSLSLMLFGVRCAMWQPVSAWMWCSCRVGNRRAT